MHKITVDEIMDLTAYERVRETMRREIIALKARRRVQLGPLVSVLFENRQTVLWQIQEMVRAERIVDPGKIAEEIEVYNELLPENGELRATLFIEIQEVDRIKSQLDRLMGIDEGDNLYFQIGRQEQIVGLFEAGRSKEDKISAVHFVTFPFSLAQRDAFRDPAVAVRLVLDHPRYRHAAVIEPTVRAALAEDFAVP